MIDSIFVARQRAAAGATLLDEERGPGWEFKVNLKYLDIGEPNDCVLAQVYGMYYSDALLLAFGTSDRIDVDPVRVVTHGFDTCSCHDHAGVSIAELNWAWRQEIGNRLFRATQRPEDDLLGLPA